MWNRAIHLLGCHRSQLQTIKHSFINQTDDRPREERFIVNAREVYWSRQRQAPNTQPPFLSLAQDAEPAARIHMKIAGYSRSQRNMQLNRTHIGQGGHHTERPDIRLLVIRRAVVWTALASASTMMSGEKCGENETLIAERVCADHRSGRRPT